MTLGAVKMMRFLYDNCRKLILKGSISDIKLVKKAIIQRKMFFILAVAEGDVSSYIWNNAFRPKCQTKWFCGGSSGFMELYWFGFRNLIYLG